MSKRIQFTKEEITPEFLQKMDGKLAWIRNDYLSMRGICYYDDPELHDFLEHVAKVKEQAESAGIVFKG